jgi:L-alanine-DL-glutamate epimerase-like enolase superfamily enzyme
MRRRDFLKAVPAAVAAISAGPRLLGDQIGGKIKITDIRIVRLKLIKDLGPFTGFMGPWDTSNVRIGGGSVIEIQTDQGLTGIGPAIDPVQLPSLKSQLVGEDVFNLQFLIANLREWTGMGTARRLASRPGALAEAGQGGNISMNLTAAGGRGGPTSSDRAFAAVEIAMWDIIGKASNQPLYKLWGPAKEQVAPYASQSRLSTPEERADFAAQIKSKGWRGIKFRAHFPTMKEDIRLVEATRKTVGDDFDIMCDANQATNGPFTPTVTWDFRRAVETARAYQALNVYWLEEPLRRYDFDHLAELNRLVEIPIAGGEGNRGLHEFRWLLEKGCFDIIQPETLLEGPLEVRKIAVIAESMDKVIAPHLGDGMVATICNLHLIASFPNSPYIEITHDLPLRDYSNGFQIFEEAPVLTKDGYLPLPQKPGLGVSIKKDLILPG